MKEFFVSDLHIGHANIIRFDNRPWTLEEQNDKIKEIWNSRVQDDDHVWLLGDVLWSASQANVAFLKSLNGVKFLVSGNHDGKFLKSGAAKSIFKEIHEGYHKHHDQQGRTIILSHYPIIQYDGVLRGNYHLYGHIHNIETDCNFIAKWKAEYEKQMSKVLEKEIKIKMYNVSMAASYMEWGPKILDEILEAN